MDSTITSVVARLNANKDQWGAIAEKSGVPLATVVKVARGYTKNPRTLTVDGLVRALDEIEAPPQ